MILIFIPCVLAISSALEAPYYNVNQAETLFENFIMTYNKTYSSIEEKQLRFEIFNASLKNINEKNSIGGAVFDINQFSDITKEELESLFGCKSVKYLSDDCNSLTDTNITTNYAPDSMNWVEKGAVTAVKNQKFCGSCYAFSAIGNIEGQYFLKNKKLVSFSEQEIVDCSKQNDGCQGGLMTNAMIDLKNLGGVQTETTYPYEGQKRECRFDVSKVVAKIAGCKQYQLKDEDKLKEILAKQGPLAIGVSGSEMLGYKKGIMTKAQCKGDVLDHGVLLVGYGTAEDGTAYWLIKNSWSPTWGEKGYIRITRGENTCGLMNDGSVTAEI